METENQTDVNQKPGDNNNTDKGDGGQNSGGENKGATWFKDIPAEMHEGVKGFATLADFVKDAQEVRGKVPKVPEKAEAYEVKLDGVVPKELHDVAKKTYDTWKEVAHGIGLTQAQFAALVDSHAKQTLGAMKKSEEDFKKDEADLKGEWKESFDVNLEKARNAFHAIFDEDDLKTFEKMKLMNNPRFIKAMFRLSSKVGEDSFTKDSGSNANRGTERDPTTGKAMLSYPGFDDKK